MEKTIYKKITDNFLINNIRYIIIAIITDENNCKNVFYYNSNSNENDKILFFNTIDNYNIENNVDILDITIWLKNGDIFNLSYPNDDNEHLQFEMLNDCTSIIKN